MNVLQRALNVFLNVIKPKAEEVGQVAFRRVNRTEREEYQEELLALLWLWTLRLIRQGKNPEDFVICLVFTAAKAVRSGRRVCQMESMRDAMSGRAQREKGFVTVPYPQRSTSLGNIFDEALQDNHRSPVPDQAAFRIDFPEWLSLHDERKRRIIEAMAEGGRTKDIAKAYELSQARISQLRRELHDSWEEFTE